MAPPRVLPQTTYISAQFVVGLLSFVRLSSKELSLLFERNPNQRKGRPLWSLVAHAYNPSYSGGRAQENRGSNPDLDK
jgi:hypothetical protein